MKKTTINTIQEIIEQEKTITAKELRERLGVSQVLVHRHLKALCERNFIKKIGSPPKVFYVLVEEEKSEKSEKFSKIIAENWLEITPNGDFLFGEDGFLLWCKERNYDSSSRKEEYERIFLEKELLKEKGLIDATEKIATTFEKNFLEKIWYIDFYSWEVFGKTLLGKLVLYAKQNSDTRLMKKIAEKIETPLLQIIEKNKFDMIAYIPHSVPRKRDFLKTTLQYVHFSSVPQKIFEKVFQQHVVAQKTLKSKADRKKNAEETLFLIEKKFPKNVLLIDDACGSGATLNIAAQKIRAISPKTKVYGLTFVGSQKGFEIISES